MPIDFIHPDVAEHLPLWERCKHASLGNEKIKQYGESYLPKLTTTQTADDYEAYLTRACFYGATGRTVNGLIGAALHEEPTMELSERLQAVVTAQNCRSAIRGLIEESRIGVLVDLAQQPGANPYTFLYNAPDIINYEYDDEGNLIFVMLRERVKGSYNQDDPYEITAFDQYRELYLDDGTYGEGTPENRVYKQIVWRYGIVEGKAGWVEIENITPMKAGVAMSVIPFILCNYEDIGPQILPPVIADLTDVNLTHYRVNADYMHGLHWTALPTPWISGVSDDNQVLAIGSGVAWKIPDPAGRAGYLEFTGQGLDAVVKALDKLEVQMAMLGARLFENQKAAEAAETARLRQNAETATLSTIVSTVEKVYRMALLIAADWVGITIDAEKTLKMSKDFISSKLSAQEVTALVAAVQANKISLETFIDCLHRGEIISTDPEEEMGRIDKQGPSLQGDKMTLDVQQNGVNA